MTGRALEVRWCCKESCKPPEVMVVVLLCVYIPVPNDTHKMLLSEHEWFWFACCPTQAEEHLKSIP